MAHTARLLLSLCFDSFTDRMKSHRVQQDQTDMMPPGEHNGEKRGRNMFRFTMPSSEKDVATRKKFLLDQCDDFLNAKALQELCAILETDSASLKHTFDGRRKSDGSVRETQELSKNELLEKNKEALFPLFDELGFIGINKPLIDQPDHILILGGALGACFNRTNAGREHVSANTKSFDGLSCYRPINPKEREKSVHFSHYETEFGVMTDAIASAFGLSVDLCDDVFSGDRNLNRISCIRTIRNTSEPMVCRVYAAPSGQPELRRADTTDSLIFYLENAVTTPHSSVLAVTNNRYCNRQFLQLALPILQNDIAVNLDIIGCSPDSDLVDACTYDPFQLMQDLIGILDWIDRFRSVGN